MTSGRFWPWFLAALLLVGVGANVALLVVADRDPSFAVEKDYYRKALSWDDAQEQARESRALGWTLALTSRPSGRGSGWTELEARLRDGGGAPVSGASVALEAFHHARAADVLEADLAPRGAGVYRAELPMRRRGLWEIRLRARLGSASFAQVLQEEIGGCP